MAEPTLVPFKDAVWIAPEEAPEYHKYKQYAHVVVPEKYAHGPEDRPVWGRVLAKGPECKYPQVKIGMRVIFGKWAPARVRWGEQEYMLVREDDLLAYEERWNELPPSLNT